MTDSEIEAGTKFPGLEFLEETPLINLSPCLIENITNRDNPRTVKSSCKREQEIRG